MGSRDGERLKQEPSGSQKARPAVVSRQLYYIAALVLSIIFGVAGQQLWQVRQAMLGDAARQMMRLGMVFAEQTGRAAQTVDLLLRDTVEVMRAPHAADFDPARLSPILRRRIEGVSQILELLVTDKNGQIVAASSRQPGAKLPPVLAEQLAAQIASPSAELRIGDPFRAPDGSWSAIMTRGIPGQGSGDAFGGLVVACLNLKYFEDFYRAVELSENGAILLHRRDGVVLARYPHSDAAVGTSYADLPPFRDILATESAGTVTMESPLDGSTRLLAIRELRAFPLAVDVSVDRGLILAPWRQQAWVLGGAVLIAGVIVAILLVTIAQRSRQIEVLVGEFRSARDAAESASAQLREQMAERERVEAALRQAQSIEVIGQLTGGVAHDFNNLLTVVLGNLEVLEDEDTLDAGQKSVLSTIRSAAERGASLTAQLLAFARRQPLMASSVNLGGVLSGMNDLLQSALGARVQVVTMLQPALWPALIDPTQVELVVLNLAINARDAMPDGGTLTLTAGNVTLGPPQREEDPPAGDYVRVVVSDTGTGMKPEVLAKAFEPFFTTKGPGRGSGLGLSQVYGVVRQSGGGVQIESAPGMGTRVTVFLPRAAEAAAKPAALARAPSPPPRPDEVAVLLVDDDPAVRSTTANLLRHLGYGVAEAESGPAALELLRSGFDPDVVLSDVAMPGMSGPALARHLSHHWPHLPVVFVSGYADPESVAGTERMQRLVRKPFRPAELATQLEAALAERRMQA